MPSTLFSTLLSKNKDKVVCVLDGLDECDESEADLEQFLLHLTTIVIVMGEESADLTGVFKLLILSRDLSAIKRQLHSFPTLNLDLDNVTDEVRSDVQRYISEKINELATEPEETRLDWAAMETVRQNSTETAAFLWIGYIAREIKGKACDEVEEILSGVPRGLDGIYRRILTQIQERVILTWLVLSRHPLTLADLVGATKVIYSSWIRDSKDGS